MTARWNGREKACPARLAQNTQVTGHCSEISTKTTLQNHIKLNVQEIASNRLFGPLIKRSQDRKKFNTSTKIDECNCTFKRYSKEKMQVY